MSIVKQTAYCPHCGNRAPQTLIYNQPFHGRWFGIDGEVIYDGRTIEMKPGDNAPAAYYVATCDTCHEVLLYRTNASDFDMDEKKFANTVLVWPDAGRLHRTVPEKVRVCYEEAARIINLAPNAFAVQIRRALEALCLDRGSSKRTSQESLKELVAKGEIPSVLADMTDVLRLIGNRGAHNSEQSVRPSDVRVIDDFFRAIVEYVYVAPSKIKAFRLSLDAVPKDEEKV